MSHPATSTMSASNNIGNSDTPTPVVNSEATLATGPEASQPLETASYELFEATVSDLKKTRQRVLHDTAGHFIGPMPLEDFFDDFMPWNENVQAAYRKVRPPQSRVDRLRSLPQCSEADSYPQFVDSFQGWIGLGPPEGMPRGSTSPLKFVDSHRHCDRDCASYSADVSIYSGLPFVAREQEQVMDFANLHCWVEIRPSADYDAFNDGDRRNEACIELSGEDEGTQRGGKAVSAEDETECEGVDEYEECPDMSNLDRATDNPERPRNFVTETDKTVEAVVEAGPDSHYPFENGTKRGRDTRAQLGSYAGAAMTTQYRNHLFSVLIVGKRARFLRWERASAIVSASFDFTEQPLLLFEFFKRFRQLTFTQRGSNPNVSPATKDEAAGARELLGKLAPELWLGAAGHLFLKRNAIDIKTQPFLKLQFGGHTFIVSAPHCSERGLSPFGRGSRGTAAVKIDEVTKEKSVCFLKDGWRDAHRISESEVYHILTERKVRNIAEMLCGGDWPASTIGHIYASKNWVLGRGVDRIGELQSCLIVLDVVGRPLVAFRKAHQLVGALADAMEAYTNALHDADIMHRDISPYNILIVNTDSGYKGILIDWDHSALLKPASAKSGLSRTGTWQFMSIALLRNPTAQHAVADDYKSVLWVLLWVVLRHLRHNLDEADLRLKVEMFDEQKLHLSSWQYLGGSEKEIQLRALSRDGWLVVRENIAEVNDLILDLTEELLARYAIPDRKIKADPARLKTWKDEHEEDMKRLSGRDWLVEKLRAVEKKLKERRDAYDGDEDWTDNVREAVMLEIPLALRPLQVSHFYLNYTNSFRASKRAAEQQEGDDDDVPEAKRIKTTSALDR